MPWYLFWIGMCVCVDTVPKTKVTPQKSLYSGIIIVPSTDKKKGHLETLLE